MEKKNCACQWGPSKKKFVSSFSFALELVDPVDLQGPNYFLQEWELRASYNWMENQSA